MSHLEEEKVVNGGIHPAPLDDQDPRFWSATAHTLYFIKRFDDAVWNYNRALKFIDKDASLWNGRGCSLVGLERSEEALPDLSKAIELDGNISKYWYDRGLAYSNLERFDEAISDLTKAVSIEEDIYEYWREIGVCYMRQKKYTEAVSHFARSHELAPDNASVFKYRGDCFFAMKEYEKAIGDYEKLLLSGEFFNDALLWYRYGISGRETNNLKAYSVQTFTTAISLGITLSDCWFQRGVAFERFHPFGFALKCCMDFETSTHMDENNPEYWYKYAYSLLWCRKEFEKAVSCFTRAIKLNEKEPKYWYGRGVGNRLIEKKEESVEDHTTALALLPETSPDLDLYRYSRGRSFMSVGRIQEAISDFSTVIDGDPDTTTPSSSSSSTQTTSTPALTPTPISTPTLISTSTNRDLTKKCKGKRALCFFDLKEYEMALKDFTVAMELDKENRTYRATPKEWSMCGECCWKLGQYEEAVKYYTEAINLYAKEASYWHGRGICYKEMGREKEAEKDLKKAIELQQTPPRSEPVSFSSAFTFEWPVAHTKGEGKEENEEKEKEEEVESNQTEKIEEKEPSKAERAPSGLLEGTLSPIGDVDKNPFKSTFPLNPPTCETASDTEKPFPSFDFDTSAFSSALSSKSSSSHPNPNPKGSRGWGDRHKRSADVDNANSTSNVTPQPYSTAPIFPSFKRRPSLLETKVGSVASWEQDIIDRNPSDLNEAYLRIGCKQESYSCMKVWLNMRKEYTVESVSTKEAKKLLAVLYVVSQGFEVDIWECKEIGESENAKTSLNTLDDEVPVVSISSACLNIACKQICSYRMKAWLHAGAQVGTTEECAECELTEVCLLLLGDPLIYRWYEVGFKLTEMKLNRPNLSCQLIFSLDSINIDSDRVVHNFLVQSLLCGSLKRNRSSSLCRSFFTSGLREVHLLPIIAGYLRKSPKSQKTKEEGEKKRNEIYIRNRNVDRYFRCLIDVCLSALEPVDQRDLVTFLHIHNMTLKPYFPSIFTFYRSVSELQFSSSLHRGDSSKLSLSCLVDIDTSLLKTLHISQCELISSESPNAPLSPLSQFDLSTLRSLSISVPARTRLKTLEGLTKDNTASLVSLSINAPLLVDISALKGCDLSLLKELSFKGCSSLSDISCLENFAFPSLSTFNVSKSHISDISPLSTWTDCFNKKPITSRFQMYFSFGEEVLHIFLEGTRVSDLSCLESVSERGGKAVKVYVNQTPLSEKMGREEKRLGNSSGVVSVITRKSNPHFL